MDIQLTKSKDRLAIKNDEGTIIVTIVESDGGLQVVCDPTGSKPMLYTVDDAWPQQTMTGTGGISIDLVTKEVE